MDSISLGKTKNLLNSQETVKGHDISCVLTNRLIEYLVLASMGYTNVEISKILCVTQSTVKKSFEDIFKKIRAVNKAHMVDIAWTHGILNNEIKYRLVNKYNIQGPKRYKKKFCE